MISFILPAYNEEGYLGDALASIAQAVQGLDQPHEVIVVDDGSTDATARVARAHGASVVAVHLRHIAAARNAGARAAKGNLLVFLDADSELPPETLRAALAALDRGAIGGGAVVRMDRKIPLRAIWVLHVWNGISRVMRWAAGCFIFVRRDAFEAVGGFDEHYFVTEEIVLSKALKRHGRFVILRQAVISSARKTQEYSIGRMLWQSLCLLAQGKRAFRNRDKLDMWYAPHRQPPRPSGAPNPSSAKN